VADQFIKNTKKSIINWKYGRRVTFQTALIGKDKIVISQKWKSYVKHQVFKRNSLTLRSTKKISKISKILISFDCIKDIVIKKKTVLKKVIVSIRIKINKSFLIIEETTNKIKEIIE